MKTLHIIFGTGVAMFLLGLNGVLADMKHESSSVPLTFSLDYGDSSVILPDLTFDTVYGTGGEEAQTTCAMTPGGLSSSGLLMQTPIVPLVHNRPEDYRRGSPQASLPPGYSLPPQPYSPNNRSRNRSPIGPVSPSIWVDPEDPTVAVPEPATLVIVGLGIGAVTIVRRRWKNY